jgi:4-amino-4-deoxy-L-arabinose transferase-like glycosyltransferase
MAGDIEGGISAYWSPLYSLLAGIAGSVLSSPEMGARIVSLICGTLLIPGTYLLGKTFYNSRTARTACLFVACTPVLINSSGWVMTEPLYSLIFLLLILTYWFALRSRRGLAFFVSGLVLGSAYLTKPEAIGFWAFCGVAAVVVALFDEKRAWRPLAAGFALTTAGLLLFVLPYVLFLKHKTGEWTISQKVSTNLPATDFSGGLLKPTPSGETTLMDRIWNDDYRSPIYVDGQSAPSESVDEPGFAQSIMVLGNRAADLFKKQIRDYLPAIVPSLFLLSAVFGFASKPWSKLRTARELYLIGLFLATIAGYAASVINVRYLFPLIPIVMCWSAYGVLAFGSWTAKTIRNLLSGPKPLGSAPFQSAAIMLLIIILVHPYFAYFSPYGLESVPLEEERAGKWIRNDKRVDEPVVMSTHATAAYYAGGNHLFLPSENLDAIADYARRRQVDYLVFSERRASKELISSLLGGPNSIPGFALVYKEDQAPQYKIYVFRAVK